MTCGVEKERVCFKVQDSRCFVIKQAQHVFYTDKNIYICFIYRNIAHIIKLNK